MGKYSSLDSCCCEDASSISIPLFKITFQNFEIGVHSLFESATLESSDRVFIFTAYTGLKRRTFDEFLFIGRRDYSVPLIPRRPLLCCFLPQEFDLNEVAHVERGTECSIRLGIRCILPRCSFWNANAFSKAQDYK